MRAKRASIARPCQLQRSLGRAPRSGRDGRGITPSTTIVSAIPWMGAPLSIGGLCENHTYALWSVQDPQGSTRRNVPPGFASSTTTFKGTMTIASSGRIWPLKSPRSFGFAISISHRGPIPRSGDGTTSSSRPTTSAARVGRDGARPHPAAETKRTAARRNPQSRFAI